jgi:hypothetical protein
VTTGVYESQLEPKPVPRHQGARRRVEEPLGFHVTGAMAVSEAYEPLALDELVRRPRRRELVVGEPDAAVRQIPNDRGRKHSVGVASARRAQDYLTGSGDGRRLLRQHRCSETLDPLDRNSRLGRHLGDSAARSQSRLHLPWAERALDASVRMSLFLAGLWLAVLQSPRRVDLLGQILVQRDDVPPCLRSSPGGEYEPPVIGGESDKVKLSHSAPWRTEPASRALFGQRSSLCLVPRGTAPCSVRPHPHAWERW